MGIDDTYLEFRKNASAIKRFCSTKSPSSCAKGNCKFADTKHRCVFASMGLRFPYEWDIQNRSKKQ